MAVTPPTLILACTHTKLISLTNASVSRKLLMTIMRIRIPRLFPNLKSIMIQVVEATWGPSSLLEMGLSSPLSPPPLYSLAICTKCHTGEPLEALKCWTAIPMLVTFTLCHGEPTQHWAMETFFICKHVPRHRSDKKLRNTISPSPSFACVSSP